MFWQKKKYSIYIVYVNCIPFDGKFECMAYFNTTFKRTIKSIDQVIESIELIYLRKALF